MEHWRAISRHSIISPIFSWYEGIRMKEISPEKENADNAKKPGDCVCADNEYIGAAAKNSAGAGQSGCGCSTTAPQGSASSFATLKEDNQTRCRCNANCRCPGQYDGGSLSTEVRVGDSEVSSNSTRWGKGRI